MRLLHWEGGRIDEPDRSLYEFDRGEWRDYAPYAMSNPGSAALHVDALEQRLEEWRSRFWREAGATLATRLDELGWERLLVAGDRRAARGLSEALPAPARERIVTEVDANLLGEDAAALAERLDAHVEAAWAREARSLAETAVESARAGGAGAIGWSEVLDSLIQRRVSHFFFVLGADPDPGRLPPHALEALGWPGRDLVLERAVEHAVAAGADVTAMGDAESDVLAAAGGAAAALRY